jgi:hypothetical protein
MKIVNEQELATSIYPPAMLLVFLEQEILVFKTRLGFNNQQTVHLMRITPRCTCTVLSMTYTSRSLASWCRIPVRKTNLEFLSLNRASIALTIETTSTSEMSVGFYETTRRNIPEDSHLQCHLLITTSIYSRAHPSDETHERNDPFERLCERRQPSTCSPERWLANLMTPLNDSYVSEHEWASSRQWTGRTHHYAHHTTLATTDYHLLIAPWCTAGYNFQSHILIWLDQLIVVWLRHWMQMTYFHNLHRNISAQNIDRQKI